MTPKVPYEYEELRRRQILQAAWDLFAEKGYHQTTMRDLGARLGVSSGVVYSYFTGKDEIFAALQERSLHAAASMFERLAENQTWKQVLAALLTEFSQSCHSEESIKHAKANIGLIAIAMRQEEMRAGASMLYEHASGAMSRLADEGRRRGEFRSGIDPKAYAHLVMALFFGLQIQSVLLRNQDFGDHVKSMTEILIENIWLDVEPRREEPGGEEP